MSSQLRLAARAALAWEFLTHLASGEMAIRDATACAPAEAPGAGIVAFGLIPVTL